MANKRISQLDEFTGTLASNDLFVFVRNATLSTQKITYANLLFSNSSVLSSVYTTVQENSAFWDEENVLVAPLQSASGYWDASYTNLVSNSSNWNATYTAVSPNSSNWNATYTAVSINSSGWTLQNVLNYLSTNNVRLSSVLVTDGLSALSIATDSISSRQITLVHIPANDGVNPVLSIGETGSLGFSGFNIGYDETQNTLTVTSVFSSVSSSVLTVDRNGTANSPFLPYTVTLSPYTTAAGTLGDFYPASLSGVIPYNEWSSRMRFGKGRIGSLLMFALSATTIPAQNKRVLVQFSQNSNFTGVTTTDIIRHTVNAGLTQYLRPIDGFMTDNSTIVFASIDNNNPYTPTAPNNPIVTYSMGTSDLYFRVGFTNGLIGNGLSLSGGYISIVP